MATSYKQPSGINIVSLAFLALLGAAGYGAWKWGPPYYSAWKVEQILHDGGSAIPSWVGQPPALRAQNEVELAQKLKSQIQDLGITDPALSVTVTDDGTDAHLTADWTVMIQTSGTSTRPARTSSTRKPSSPSRPACDERRPPVETRVEPVRTFRLYRRPRPS